MSSRLTFASVKQLLSRVLSINATDARVAEYCSRAQERLMEKGKWVGTFGRFRVCVNDACLTWPRELETIEAVSMCGQPLTVRDQWYEFLSSGPGILSESIGPGLTIVDRGDAVAFDDIKGTGKYLAIYCDGNESGAQILMRYYDSNGNKVYSTVGGAPVEGEYLTLPTPPGWVYSSYEVLRGGWYGCVKPVTLRQVRVYEYTLSTGALKPLAYFEPDETNPVYRRSVIPGLSNSCGGGESGDCGATTVDVVGKFRPRDVRKDSDALIIQSREALRLMVQAIRKEENNLWDDAAKYELRAEKLLADQLSHWNGSGKVTPMRRAPRETWGGGVANIQ